MSEIQTPVPKGPVQDPMAEIVVRLGDLGLAPENLRFDEPADEGVPQLADTLTAAGLIVPPIVRPGREGEPPYVWALRQAKARHLAKAVAELESLGPPPRTSAPVFTPRDWMETLGGSFHGNMGYMTLVVRSLGQPETNWRDLVAFQSSGAYSNPMLLTEFSNFVIDDRSHTYAVPIFLLSGRYDQQSEASVAHGFFDKVIAPQKAFVWFENSAHNPPFEEPRVFTDWVSHTIAPLGERAQGG